MSNSKPVAPGFKHCPRCNQAVSLEHFYINPKTLRVFSYCKPCQTTISKEARQRMLANRGQYIPVQPRRQAEYKPRKKRELPVYPLALPVIYFVQEQSPYGFIKIGFATQFKTRLSALKVDNPWGLRVLLVVEGDREVEKNLHWEFVEDHFRGEWFRPSAAILSYIEARQGDHVPTYDHYNNPAQDGAGH